MNRLRMLICVAGLGVAGCSQPTLRHTDGTDLAAITAFNQRYLQSINDGDFATLSAMTTADHIMMVPNRPAIVGKAANDEANRRSLEQFHIVETWNVTETQIEGPLAFQRGTYTSASTPKAGGAGRGGGGKFLRVYRRQPDGSWSMYIDMFSSDAADRPQ
jgi:ketosteroid isomerase-like protein